MPLVIAMRFLQAVAAAFLIATSMAIVADIAPRGQLGRFVGLAIGATYIGLASGPYYAGLVTTHLGWRWVFFLAAIPPLRRLPVVPVYPAQPLADADRADQRNQQRASGGSDRRADRRLGDPRAGAGGIRPARGGGDPRCRLSRGGTAFGQPAARSRRDRRQPASHAGAAGAVPGLLRHRRHDLPAVHLPPGHPGLFAGGGGRDPHRRARRDGPVRASRRAPRGPLFRRI